MLYHTEIMFLEILNLNYLITDETTLSLKKLEDAFYALQDIINTKEKLSINNIFEEELEKLLETIPEAIAIEDDKIILTKDIDLAYDDFLLTYNKLTMIDYDIEEYVQNIFVYSSLNLPIPLDDTKETFKLNRRIIQLYLSIAEQDYKGLSPLSLIETLKSLLNELKNILNEADDKQISKIKMCCAYYNNELLDDSEKDFANSDWRIILFSNNDKLLLSLCFDKVEYISEMIDYKRKNEDEDLLNVFFDSDEDIEEDNTLPYIDHETKNIDEIPLFLTYYLIYLSKFIDKNRSFISKQVLESLIIKKYFLLSIPDLSNIEDYYLEHYTIDNLEPPKISKEWFTDTSFQVLQTQTTECALSLDYSDEEIKRKPYLYSKIIINSLFIKCFLELSINEKDKNSIISLITNTRYYKDKYYQIASTIIDEIIFDNNINLSL